MLYYHWLAIEILVEEYELHIVVTIEMRIRRSQRDGDFIGRFWEKDSEKDSFWAENFG